MKVKEDKFRGYSCKEGIGRSGCGYVKGKLREGRFGEGIVL